MTLHGLPYCVRVAYKQVLREKYAEEIKELSEDGIDALLGFALTGLEMDIQVNELTQDLVRAMELLAEGKVDLS